MHLSFGLLVCTFHVFGILVIDKSVGEKHWVFLVLKMALCLNYSHFLASVIDPNRLVSVLLCQILLSVGALFNAVFDRYFHPNRVMVRRCLDLKKIFSEFRGRLLLVRHPCLR